MSIITPMVRPMVRPMVTAMGEGGQRTPAQIIQGLFAAGQQGFWLPFTDFASLSQDSAGTLPYTALEQPVGLILDKSKGGGRGPELSPNGGTFDDAAGWTITHPTSSISGGVLNVGAGACDIFPSTASVVVGKSYEVTFTISNSTANYGIRILNRDIIGTGDYFPAGGQYITANGSYRFVCVALSNGSIGVNRVIGHTGSLQVDNFSVKEIPGNHATQPTSTARGVVSARVNAIFNTDNPSAWGYAGSRFSVGAKDADGGWPLTALINNSSTLAAVNTDYPIGSSGVTDATIVCSIELQAGTASFVRFGAAGIGVVVDLVTKAIVSNPGGLPVTVVQLADNWVRVESWSSRASFFASVLSNYLVWGLSQSGGLIDASGQIGSTIKVRKPSYSRQALGHTAPVPFQRVGATPTDYDSVGFPKYARLDGTDDFYTCAGGGSTTGFYYADVIRPMGGAGTRRVIWSDRSGNNGYELAINTANKLEFSAGNGTTITTVETTQLATLAEGKRYEVMDDGTNLSVQIDGSAPVTIARPVVTAGSPTITLYRGASTGYFNGQFTEPIYRAGPPPSAYERSVIRGYQMQKAGL